jgi:hypothetical protein
MKPRIITSLFISYNVANQKLQKITLCSNSATLQCYNTVYAIWQHFVQNNV